MKRCNTLHCKQKLDEIGELTKSAGTDIMLMNVLDKIHDKVIEIKKLM